MLRTILIIVVIFSFLHSPGQTPLLFEDRLEDTQGEDGIEITEFIFNETITKLGSDFYYHFFQNWHNPSDIEGFSIHIKERPIPGMGGIVSIEIEDQQVYQGFLRPNRQQIIDAATVAIERCQSYLVNYELIQQQLESEDQSGSGIY
jgi:curli production assembly/transport component CsgE